MKSRVKVEFLKQVEIKVWIHYDLNDFSKDRTDHQTCLVILKYREEIRFPLELYLYLMFKSFNLNHWNEQNHAVRSWWFIQSSSERKKLNTLKQFMMECLQPFSCGKKQKVFNKRCVGEKLHSPRVVHLIIYFTPLFSSRFHTLLKHEKDSCLHFRHCWVTRKLSIVQTLKISLLTLLIQQMHFDCFSERTWTP